MKHYRKRIKDMRTEINQAIIELLHKHNYYYEVTICCNDTPLLRENPHDDALTLTLDCVGIRNGQVYFEGTSIYESITLFADQIYIELLINIYEWLLENEEEIFNEDL